MVTHSVCQFDRTVNYCDTYAHFILSTNDKLYKMWVASIGFPQPHTIVDWRDLDRKDHVIACHTHTHIKKICGGLSFDWNFSVHIVQNMARCNEQKKYHSECNSMDIPHGVYNVEIESVANDRQKGKTILKQNKKEREKDTHKPKLMRANAMKMARIKKRTLWSHQSSCIIHSLACNEPDCMYIACGYDDGQKALHTHTHTVKSPSRVRVCNTTPFVQNIHNNKRTMSRSHRRRRRRILRAMQNSIIVKSILWQLQCEIDQHAYGITRILSNTVLVSLYMLLHIISCHISSECMTNLLKFGRLNAKMLLATVKPTLKLCIRAIAFTLLPFAYHTHSHCMHTLCICSVYAVNRINFNFPWFVHSFGGSLSTVKRFFLPLSVAQCIERVHKKAVQFTKWQIPLQHKTNQTKERRERRRKNRNGVHASQANP